MSPAPAGVIADLGQTPNSSDTIQHLVANKPEVLFLSCHAPLPVSCCLVGFPSASGHKSCKLCNSVHGRSNHDLFGGCK